MIAISRVTRNRAHLIRLSRSVPPAVGENLGAESLRLFPFVALEDSHQVSDVRRGQPQSLDLREFGVGRNVRDAVPQIGEGVVYALRATAFLLVRGVSPLRSDRNATALVNNSLRMEMLLKGADRHAADDLLAYLMTARELVPMTRRMVMVRMVMMMMG